ncbi:MAG: hypothetical protein V7750_06745 [Sneathiella sp.]
MKWNLTLILVLIVAAVSYGLYQLSYEVQQLGTDLRKLRAGITENRASVQVLKAEWAYENRPANLQILAAKHLPLLLVAPYQVAEIQDLPSRVTDPFAASLSVIPVPRFKPWRRGYGNDDTPQRPLHVAKYVGPSQIGEGVE